MPPRSTPLGSWMPSFTEEMLKQAGLKELVAKMPFLVKSLPAKGKAVVDKASLQAARLGSKYPTIYKELHDPTNYGPALSSIKRIIGG